MDILQPQPLSKVQVILLDLLKAFFAEVHQVHLVDRHDGVLDAQQ